MDKISGKMAYWLAMLSAMGLVHPSQALRKIRLLRGLDEIVE